MTRHQNTQEEAEEEEAADQRRWSLLAKILGDPLNTQHAKEEAEEEAVVVVVVFTRENRGGTVQHATRATPTRSSHAPTPSPVPSLSTAAL